MKQARLAILSALLAIAACNRAPKVAADETITMADKSVFDPSHAVPDGDSNIIINGTITGKGVGYRNNTLTAMCSQSKMNCQVATLEQIGANHVSEIRISDWPITTWSPELMVATDDGICAKTTFSLLRASDHIAYVVVPQNLSEPVCAKADPATYQWTVEGSLYWEREHKRVATSG